MTIFTTTIYPVGALIVDIDLGKVGLPDLQRPFVWRNVRVRNLIDSLYKGYPAGFLLFWDTGAEGGLKGIGAKKNKAIPRLAIVDGQQRLRCEPGPGEAFLKDGQNQRFFVRGGNATAELQGNSITQYVKQRFGNNAT